MNCKFGHDYTLRPGERDRLRKEANPCDSIKNGTDKNRELFTRHAHCNCQTLSARDSVVVHTDMYAQTDRKSSAVRENVCFSREKAELVQVGTMAMVRV
jgi:hypothetical protein